MLSKLSNDTLSPSSFYQLLNRDHCGEDCADSAKWRHNLLFSSSSFFFFFYCKEDLLYKKPIKEKIHQSNIELYEASSGSGGDRQGQRRG